MTRSSGRRRTFWIARVQVLGALAGEPVERLQVLDREPEEVAAALHQAALEELAQDGPAGALDVHPTPAKWPNSWPTRAGHAAFAQ